MSLLDRVRYCQQRSFADYRRFVVAGEAVGWVRHGMAERIAREAAGFHLSPAALTLAPSPDGFAERTAAMRDLLRRLEREGLVTGWRDEDYPVAAAYGRAPLLRMERAGVPAFGVQGYGVHLNGHVGRGDDLRLWIGRRSPTKQTAPNKLDHLVAGGQPFGLGLFDNLIKECAEEASLPGDLAAQARPVGAISYVTEHEGGLRNDVLFCYDLELPEEFVPVNRDGEIAEFQLWPIARVIERLADTEDFKFNVSLVIIDFLIRHGLIDPEHPDYLEIIAGLHYSPGQA
jgi:uncharacterized protein DUF4743